MNYVFAYHIHGIGWTVCNTYFAYQNDNDDFCGQFLSSNWFSHNFTNFSQDFHFVILGNNNRFDIEKTQKILNTHNNIVPSVNDVDFDRYQFAEYFTIESSTTQKIYDSLEDNDSCIFNMRGKVKTAIILSIRVRKFQLSNINMMGISLPSFTK